MNPHSRLIHSRRIFGVFVSGFLDDLWQWIWHFSAWFLLEKSCLTTEADALAFFLASATFTFYLAYLYLHMHMYVWFLFRFFFFWESSTAQKLGQRMSPARFNTRSSLIFIHLHVLHCIRCSLFIIRGLQPGSQTVTASNKWQLPQIASSAVVAYL